MSRISQAGSNYIKGSHALKRVGLNDLHDPFELKDSVN